MSTSSMNPKLLMEFYKDQKVPMLVKKRPDSNHVVNPLNNRKYRQNQSPPKKTLTSSLLDNYFSKVNASKNTPTTKQNIGFSYGPKDEQQNQRNYDQYSPSVRNYSNSQSASPPVRSQQIAQPKKTYQQKLYEQQMEKVTNLNKENYELHILTKQLTQKSIQLKTINNQLLQRIQQLESINQSFKKHQEYEKCTNSTFENKIRNKVYQELNFYIRDAVTQFTDRLANQKMSPIVQAKVQQFLGVILNLNDFTVNNNHHRNISTKISHRDVDDTIHDIIMHEKQNRLDTKNRQNSSSPISKYQTVFEKLNAVSNRKQSKGKSVKFDDNISNVQHSSLSDHQSRSIHNDRNQMSASPTPIQNRDGRQGSASKRRTRIFNKSYATEWKQRESKWQNQQTQEDRRPTRNLFSENFRNPPTQSY